MIRWLGFLTLIIVLIASLFRLGGAEATNNVTALALMILLVTLFSDLRKFDFWGLKGEQIEKKLKALEGKRSLTGKKLPKPKPTEVLKAEQAPLQLAETMAGNFLTVSYEIDRLLRVAAKLLGSTAVERDLLTEAGIQQVEAIHRLREQLISDKASDVEADVLELGFRIAFKLYTELNEWLI